MKFLKVYPDGKSKVINLNQDISNYNNLMWFFSVELSKEVSDSYVPSEILVDTGVVVIGPDKNYYPEEPLNKWASDITGEEIHGPCICFSIRKYFRNTYFGTYKATGFTQHETKCLKWELKKYLYREHLKCQNAG